MPIKANTAIIGRAGNEEPVFGEVADDEVPLLAETLVLPPPLLPPPTLTVTD
jgi:hypothetical protein